MSIKKKSEKVKEARAEDLLTTSRLLYYTEKINEHIIL